MAWVTPVNRSDGFVVTGSRWNQDVVDNILVLKTSINDAGTIWAGTIGTFVATAHAIGTNAATNAGLFINVTATAVGALATSVRIDGTVTAAANSDTLALLNVGQVGVWATAGFTNLGVSVLRVIGSTLADTGAGTIVNASTVEIVDAPVEGVNNYALRVVSGITNLGGALGVTGATSLNTLNVLGAATFSSTVKSSAQPGFLAYNSVDDTVQTSGALIDFNTEVYDETNNFSGDTFTAPTAGRYLLAAAVRFADNGNNALDIDIATSARFYRIYANPNVTTGGASGSVIADLGVGDTAHVTFSTANANVTIKGSSSPHSTYFCGRLLV